MGLKKASVEFAVCHLTLASFSEEAVKQELIDCSEVLLALLFRLFFVFFLCEKTILARDQEFVPKGI